MVPLGMVPIYSIPNFGDNYKIFGKPLDFYGVYRVYLNCRQYRQYRKRGAGGGSHMDEDEMASYEAGYALVDEDMCDGCGELLCLGGQCHNRECGCEYACEPEVCSTLCVLAYGVLT